MKNLSFSERLLSNRTDTSTNRNTTPLLCCLVFIFLFTVVSASFMPCDEQFDDDGLSFLEGGTEIWNIGFLPLTPAVAAFQLGIIAIIPIFEYLQTRVGEKRPASKIISINNSSSPHANSSVTALFYRAVLFCFLLQFTIVEIFRARSLARY